MLTTGDRGDATAAALRSLGGRPTCLVANGGGDEIAGEFPDLRVLASEVNVGVPAGRDLGVRSSSADVIGFLDDDATASPHLSERIVQAFADAPDVGAIALRIVDEHGETDGWFVPRPAGRGADRSGDVALVLGGACAVRRTAYEEVGGYWGELFYGHEEVELCWRLIGAGWRIVYLADAVVTHPKVTVGRHDQGWWYTGRNRVMVARRTLPAVVAGMHVVFWLAAGLLRSARERCGRSYLRGWAAGWRQPVERRSIGWRAVWRLTRLGRPPVI